MDVTEAAAVLARARQGDSEAFRELVERHSRSVFRLAYRMTGNEQDAEDVVQESFLRAYRQLGRFESRANFGTWLYRIVSNCSVDLMRAKQARHDQVHGDSLDDAVPLERAAFTLRHYEGRSIEEISAALNLGTSAAKHSVFRAVKKLRIALAPLRSQES